MSLQLTNKIALVTGASGGLGFATALRLAQEGCKVIISSRSPENLAHAASLIKEETGNIVWTKPADVSKKAAIDSLFEFIQEEFGQIDIVVSNSGGPKVGKFENIPDDWWYQAVDNNFMSTVWLFQRGLAMMKANKTAGRLLVITTTGAKQPQDNLILSNTTRAAVHALVKTLSRDIAQLSITVNAVVPGKFMTDRQMSAVKGLANRENLTIEEAITKRLSQVPIGRMGEPKELANYIAFLCSPQADYITGTAMNIDGGYMSSI